MLTGSLLSAIAEAVFGHLLQEADLVERARAILSTDPECKVFQTALARACTTILQVQGTLGG